MKSSVKVGAVAAASVLAVSGLAACSGSSSSSSSASATSASPTTSSASPTSTESPYIGATCTSESIGDALPEGSSVTAFKCASVGDGQIAAVDYGPGTNIVFLKTTGIGGPWQIVSKDSVCGGASAGLPPAILKFCSM